MEEAATHASSFLRKEIDEPFPYSPRLERIFHDLTKILKNAFFTSKDEHIPEIWCIDG